MPDPIIYDPRPLLTFVDAPPVAALCVGVVLGVVLAVVFAGAAVLAKGARPAARHRPSGGRQRVAVPATGTAWPPKHTTAALAETQALPIHASYLGPQPVTTGGAR